MSEAKLKVVLKPIEWLKPYPLNAKVHTDAQVDKIVQSMNKFGWTTAITVDINGEIIAGHGRRLAGIKRGDKQVPVVVRDDLTPEEVRALRLADNRVSSTEYDVDLLKADLSSLEFDLDGIFDKKELDFFAVDLGTITADVFVEDVEREAVKMAGETTRHVEEADARPVKIDKALGFKTISGADERAVARFMATIEAATGRTGVDAFVAHAKQTIGASE
ncbi:ParB/Srx family N-terminal domain-containing protein [Burkholderia gladioli]|uniref:ParB/Srx family N-terminal domain-containing protein n=1 Tax=Burkholderia gladioli TaxID=28095 RepID=UPI003B506FD6